jgi:hypothetical protein
MNTTLKLTNINNLKIALNERLKEEALPEAVVYKSNINTINIVFYDGKALQDYSIKTTKKIMEITDKDIDNMVEIIRKGVLKSFQPLSLKQFAKPVRGLK